MGTEKRARQKELHRSRLEAAQKEAQNQAKKRTVVNVSLLALVAVLAAGAFVFFGKDDEKSSKAASASDKTAQSTSSTPVSETVETTVATSLPEAQDVGCPAADGSSERVAQFTKAPAMCIDPAKNYTAKVTTNQGEFTIALDAKKAPKTVNNFVTLARYHYFDGLIFHRIIKDFMFQGGDPTGTGSGGPGYDFEDELPQQGDYEKYSVAMANSGPDTNGSQFFVITGPSGVSLPPSYSLFGKVTDGTDVADKIGLTATAQGDRPLEDVVMTSVIITES